MLIINVPIEPIENRYSVQWLKWSEHELSKIASDSIRFHTILGDTPPSSTIKSNLFLDPFATNIYKSTQMARILARIRDEYEDGERNFSLFFHDLWFPGIEKLRYVENMMEGMKIQINGIFHAGTWDEHDLTYTSGMGLWAKEFQLGWMFIADNIFVATNFHKKLIFDYANKVGSVKIIETLANKVSVTFLPFYEDDCIKDWPYSLRATEQEVHSKENWIAFPHRLSNEKGMKELEILKDAIVTHKLPLEVKVTHELCKTKKEYYELLKKCKYSISFAYQETFGISMVESVFAGCIPIVPDALSYKETIFDAFRYHVSLASLDSARRSRVFEALELIKRIELFELDQHYSLAKANAEMLDARCKASLQTMIGKSLSSFHIDEDE